MGFEAAAQQYCEVGEQASATELDAFVDALAASLANVVAEVTRLPNVEPSDQELPARATDDAWKERFREIHEALKPYSSYSTTLSPYGAETPEAVILPLADDLADIWRDLKAGLVHAEQAEPQEDIRWEWRFGFYAHWGRHATEALRALHAIQAERGGPLHNTA